MSDDAPSGASAPRPPQYPGASPQVPPTEPVPVVDPTVQLPVTPPQPLTAPQPPFVPPTAAPPSFVPAPTSPPPTSPPPTYQQPLAAPPYAGQSPAPNPLLPNPTPPAPKGNRGRFIVLGLLLASVVGLAVVAAFLAGRNDDDLATDLPVTTPTTEPPAVSSTEATETETLAGDELPRSVADLAKSTVMILLVDGSGQPLCSGSGTIVEADGTILTNAHVVANDEFCPFEAVHIAVTDDAGTPPEPLYEADILLVDDGLDLAVLRVARNLDGTPSSATFTPTVIGDSDTVELGDSIRILGYPDIGGETITFTVGTVSGFTSQSGAGERSWIKTDATIAGGNSGGTAVNDEGELIGIPTQGGADDDSPVVDCRILTDTNGDGLTDDNDQCVPFGGFLNGIRPVNLAADLLAQAKSAAPMPIGPPDSDADSDSEVDFDLSEAYFYNPRFSVGVPTDDTSATTTFVTTVAAGGTELCFWFDWTGMPEGAPWDATWLVDGELVEEYSFFDQTWESPGEGSEYWVCATNADGFVPGLYELSFQVAGEPMFLEGLEVTEEPVDSHLITVVNDTEVEACYVMANPASSTQYGIDVLGVDEYLAPGATIDLELSEGEHSIAVFDCDSEYLGGNDLYTVTGPDSLSLAGG